MLNATPESEPRVYFGDGITTYKTDYRKWTQVVVDAYRTALRPYRAGLVADRSLSFALQSINCSGHYLADCSLSLLITRGDGVQKVFSTDKYNGYPIESALNKALNASVELALEDEATSQYIGKTDL